jgi:ADP-ribose pyrophosphatase YjhB (NUDIX family)
MRNTNYLSATLYKKIRESVPILNIDAIMYNDEGELFLQYRKEIPHNQKWTLIGGRLRKHENIIKCLRRHIAESGLHICDIQFAGYYDWKTYDSRQHAVSLVFLTKVKGIPKTGKFFTKYPTNMPRSVRTCTKNFNNGKYLCRKNGQ